MNKQSIKVTCKICKQLKIVKPSRAKYFKTCSRQCWSKMMKGHKPFYWKGGRIYHKGYIYILKKEHPAADRDGYILEHRFIMEQHLKRHLHTKEIVHHKNKNRSDNRIKNLELCVSQSKHMSKHYPKGKAFSNKKYIRDKLGRVTGVI